MDPDYTCALCEWNGDDAETVDGRCPECTGRVLAVAECPGCISRPAALPETMR
ncbi:MAG: hypothetical protein ABEI97_05165 [Candidatus Nanohaloarchaea archaeon]